MKGPTARAELALPVDRAPVALETHVSGRPPGGHSSEDAEGAPSAGRTSRACPSHDCIHVLAGAELACGLATSRSLGFAGAGRSVATVAAVDLRG